MTTPAQSYLSAVIFELSTTVEATFGVNLIYISEEVLLAQYPSITFLNSPVDLRLLPLQPLAIRGQIHRQHDGRGDIRPRDEEEPHGAEDDQLVAPDHDPGGVEGKVGDDEAGVEGADDGGVEVEAAEVILQEDGHDVCKMECFL